MNSSTIGGRRARVGLAAAGIAALLALPTTAPADELTPQEIQSDAYLMARLRAGQSWDSGELSINELRPGTVDRTQLETYVQQQAGMPATAIGPTLDLLAALGPQVMTAEGDVMVLQTASAGWGEPGLIPRSHRGEDGVWEFPRRPDQDELDMLVGQRWRIVESIESQILFLGPDRELGWDDVADLVNPLQHIPLISIAYRAVTGDRIYGAASLLDIGFGPIAGAGTVLQLAYQSTTGETFENQAIAAIFGPGADDDLAGVYTTASRQIADREPVRRGSNQ